MNLSWLIVIIEHSFHKILFSTNCSMIIIFFFWSFLNFLWYPTSFTEGPLLPFIQHFLGSSYFCDQNLFFFLKKKKSIDVKRVVSLFNSFTSIITTYAHFNMHCCHAYLFVSVFSLILFDLGFCFFLRSIRQINPVFLKELSGWLALFEITYLGIPQF